MVQIIHISFQKVYQYKGWLFEWDKNKPFEPWPLKKDYTPRKQAGRLFYKAFDEFYQLTTNEQEAHRVQPGLVLKGFKREL